VQIGDSVTLLDDPETVVATVTAPTREVEAAITDPREPQPYADRASRTIAPLESYLEALPDVTAGPLRIAYTPLHGVGGAVFVKALRDRVEAEALV